MNNKRATKRALLTSVMALVMCVVMLVGTTFAWFTDTASTGVNKIQAGNLDVDIVGEDGKTLDGKTLNFVNKENQSNILWEPGATFFTQGFKIVNKGNLALKYKVVVSGTTGDAKLLKAIKFDVVTEKAKNAEAVSFANEGNLLKQNDSVPADVTTDAGTTTNYYYLRGHMDENAGNEYKNLTLDGISITVYATQYTYENDSFGPDYDKNATYYPVLDAAGMKDALVNGGNIKVDANVDPSEVLVVAKDTTIDMNGKTIANTNEVWKDDSNSWSLISARESADLTITGNGTFAAKANDCYAVDVQDGATVTIENGTFIGNIHAVYVLEGTAYIKGGFYSVQQKYPDAAKADEFVLNCLDANYKNNKSANIIVTGGTFVNFNPADCKAEGAGTNFVADGYSVISETKANGDVWYTVVKGTGVVPGTQEDLNNGITQTGVATPSKDVTVVMPASSTFTLDNGIAHEGAKSRNVTFIGDGTQTVDVVAKSVNAAEGSEMNYQRGSSFAFQNVTVQGGTTTYGGIVCNELTFENCTIKGKLTLYGKATFINCVFENTMVNQYSIWTWGGTDVTFEGCTFNTNGKAILLFGEEKTTNLTVNNCVFNDRNNGAAGKAAIEIGEANYGKHNNFTVVINGSTVASGFAVNSEGTSTNSKLWANKNSMDATHLSVTIDGTKVQ